MVLRAKLTTLDSSKPNQPKKADGAQPPERSEEERAARKERVQKVKDALKTLATTKGDHVPAARASLKAYLQNLNEPNQPSDERFTAMLDNALNPPRPKAKGDGRR